MEMNMEFFFRLLVSFWKYRAFISKVAPYDFIIKSDKNNNNNEKNTLNNNDWLFKLSQQISRTHAAQMFAAHLRARAGDRERGIKHRFSIDQRSKTE